MQMHHATRTRPKKFRPKRQEPQYVLKRFPEI